MLLVLLAVMLTACDQPPFADQPKYEPYEAAWDWPEDQSALQPVPGTVSRDASLGPVPETLPVPLTQELLARGRQRYRIYCTPCHGKVGYGNGLVVQHGFPAPPSYHTARLRNASLRHFYDVISDGYGVMYSYAARVAPRDRWAIAAYIRALQLSQHAPVRTLTPRQRAKLEGRQ
ncbi:MAG: cytochrome c [Nitrococcus sp.]|nr:cytochrome c [Nitrococcus sp.]